MGTGERRGAVCWGEGGSEQKNGAEQAFASGVGGRHGAGDAAGCAAEAGEHRRDACATDAGGRDACATFGTGSTDRRKTDDRWHGGGDAAGVEDGGACRGGGAG